MVLNMPMMPIGKAHVWRGSASRDSENIVTIDYELSHDGDSYHMETSPFICTVNQWTGFYMIGTSTMKELKEIVTNDE